MSEVTTAGTVQMPALLTQDQFCKYVGKSRAWAERARFFGDGPKYLKLGRAVRYRAEDVTAWLNSCARTSISESSEGMDEGP